MLADILAFAAATLVDAGRLAMWIPAENVDTQEEIGIPSHPCLRRVSISTQAFSRCTSFPSPAEYL